MKTLKLILLLCIFVFVSGCVSIKNIDRDENIGKLFHNVNDNGFYRIEVNQLSIAEYEWYFAYMRRTSSNEINTYYIIMEYNQEKYKDGQKLKIKIDGDELEYSLLRGKRLVKRNGCYIGELTAIVDKEVFDKVRNGINIELRIYDINIKLSQKAREVINEYYDEYLN